MGEMNWWSPSARILHSVWNPHTPQLVPIRDHFSPVLDRPVDIDIYLPPGYDLRHWRSYPLLICNDGQDLPRMQVIERLEDLYRHHSLPHLIVAAVHANEERHREYGTARQPDYKGRGDKAAAYGNFVVNELLPLIYQGFRITGRVEETAIAGFSLGGLSALDIAWHNPRLFGTVGVFSGSLWWRWAPVEGQNIDADRIIHDIVRQAPGPNPGQRFWFQCGTHDETEDRNGNGIIDSIDDTLDLIRELQAKGYPDDNIRYVQIEGGEHAPQTWGEALPDFLLWTYGRRQK